MPFFIADAAERDPGIEMFVQTVVAGHLVTLAALFVKPQPGPPTLLKIILNPESDDRANPSKRVAHQAEQGAVAQADEFNGDEFTGID